MKTISNNIDNEIIINKSKFITKLIKINDKKEIREIIDDLKKQDKDATHICYAYIINGKMKAIDDGEPSGTAGVPILNVLKQNDLDYILGVVIRYFGGIKLGSGGLIRAYSNSITEALNKTTIKDIEYGKLISIKFNYNDSKEIEYILKDYEIINKNYDDLIEFKLIANDELINKLKKYNLKISIEKELIY